MQPLVLLVIFNMKAPFVEDNNYLKKVNKNIKGTTQVKSAYKIITIYVQDGGINEYSTALVRDTFGGGQVSPKPQCICVLPNRRTWESAKAELLYIQHNIESF